MLKKPVKPPGTREKKVRPPIVRPSGEESKVRRGTPEIVANRSDHWIADLAEPYLRGYLATKAADELTGYWFAPPQAKGTLEGRNQASKKFPGPYGFFVGYLRNAAEYGYLNGKAPECLVFVWFAELGGADHARLVAAPSSLLRKTHTYIGWLTHRLPRFELYADQFIALVRHRTMLDWPEDKHEHYSKNFFIETLAWLVRSGLVKGLKTGDGSRLEV